MNCHFRKLAGGHDSVYRSYVEVSFGASLRDCEAGLVRRFLQPKITAEHVEQDEA